MLYFCVVQVQIIQLDEDRGEFVLKATFDHPYPTTKIMWIPDQVNLIIRIIVKISHFMYLHV